MTEQATPREPDSLKETLISIVIAFALALVGRSYVIEPFVIPTGSMAPTLNGAHMRFHSPESGFEWAVNPRDESSARQTPLPVQGARRSGDPIVVRDPVTGAEMRRFDEPLRAGDRILVLKYLYSVREPKRYDVVVFKNPENPQENFIKRLLGLPGEEILIADGDLFTRRPGASEPTDRAWRVQRKPRRVQNDVWWPVFSSEFTPVSGAAFAEPWLAPWSGEGWDTAGPVYRAAGAEPGELVWDALNWPITDDTPYNQTREGRHGRIARFPVADVRLRAGVEPDSDGLRVIATIIARSHEYQGVVEAGTATVRMRPLGETSWTTLATGQAPTLRPGRATPVEFIHVDQSLELRVGGRRAAFGVYEWTPEERLRHALRDGVDLTRGLPLASPGVYGETRVSWSFTGSPVALHNVGLDRDLHWRTDISPGSDRGYARGTAPDSALLLESEQYYMCGDNSPSSRDSRLWDSVDPWVAEAAGDRVGVVHRDLLMGKAFFVYFPAPHQNLGPIPVPDFGRLRFIR